MKIEYSFFPVLVILRNNINLLFICEHCKHCFHLQCKPCCLMQHILKTFLLKVYLEFLWNYCLLGWKLLHSLSPCLQGCHFLHRQIPQQYPDLQHSAHSEAKEGLHLQPSLRRDFIKTWLKIQKSTFFSEDLWAGNHCAGSSFWGNAPCHPKRSIPKCGNGSEISCMSQRRWWTPLSFFSKHLACSHSILVSGFPPTKPQVSIFEAEHRIVELFWWKRDRTAI